MRRSSSGLVVCNALATISNRSDPSQSGPPGYNGYTGQHAAADRMRELLARTVQDHIVEERTTAAALQDIRQRLNDLDDASAAGIAASLDGLAASLGTLDSKLTARLERLDERLDDQYDRVRALESALVGPTAHGNASPGARRSPARRRGR